MSLSTSFTTFILYIYTLYNYYGRLWAYLGEVVSKRKAFFICNLNVYIYIYNVQICYIGSEILYNYI